MYLYRVSQNVIWNSNDSRNIKEYNVYLLTFPKSFQGNLPWRDTLFRKKKKSKNCSLVYWQYFFHKIVRKDLLMGPLPWGIKKGVIAFFLGNSQRKNAITPFLSPLGGPMTYESISINHLIEYLIVWVFFLNTWPFFFKYYSPWINTHKETNLIIFIYIHCIMINLFN